MNNALILAIVLLFVGLGAGLLVGLSLGHTGDTAPLTGSEGKTVMSKPS